MVISSNIKSSRNGDRVDKLNKMLANRVERPMGPFPLGLFLVSSGPAYGQNIGFKALNQSGWFPRQSLSKNFTN
jgi:hypothetical protein